MIPAYLSPLFNHLWQSTLFAAAVGLLVLALKKNHAQARHRLWLIASIKFLIPFSLLVAVGSHLGWSSATPVARPALSVAMEEISQPFTTPATALSGSAAVAPTSASIIPIVLFGIWTCGFIAVAVCWWIRWRRLHAVVAAASPLALKAATPVLESRALLEPGVFGIFRPVLLLPEGIADRLAPAQLEAILAHEMCHVRRRDNLAAALHMAVEAIFWFHPLVWWLGARLLDERERACDEEVLRLGNEPQVYAESILKTCEFYLESPLACVSGITGSDLKKRIVRIMARRGAKKLDQGRKLLLAAAGIAAVAGPVLFGLVNAPQSRAQSETSPSTTPSFEVASIKPDKSDGRNVMLGMAPGGRFTANNVTLRLLMQEAYGVKDSQISGGPAWINSERYDIQAKPEDSVASEMEKLSPEQRRDRLMRMVQSLLVDRFKLTLGHETKELPVYVLLVAKNGAKFHETNIALPDSPPQSPSGPQNRPPVMGPRIRMMGRGHLRLDGVSLDMFANVLSRQLGRIVLDKTGLKGRYDFKLQWTPDENDNQTFEGPPSGGAGKPPADSAPPPDASGPSIFTALQEQLGLKLESQKGPVDILVIDHVEKPSEN